MTESIKAKENSSPPNFYLSQVGSSFIQLNWDPQSLAEFKPKCVRITAAPVNQSVFTYVRNTTFDLGLFILDRLDFDTFYNVSAEVFGNRGRIFAYNTSIKTLSKCKLMLVNVLYRCKSEDYAHRD